MRQILARLLRAAACTIDEHRPITPGDDTTSCGSCGVVMINTGFIQRLVDESFERVWKDIYSKRVAPRARA